MRTYANNDLSLIHVEHMENFELTRVLPNIGLSGKSLATPKRDIFGFIAYWSRVSPGREPVYGVLAFRPAQRLSLNTNV